MLLEESFVINEGVEFIICRGNMLLVSCFSLFIARLCLHEFVGFFGSLVGEIPGNCDPFQSMLFCIGMANCWLPVTVC